MKLLFLLVIFVVSAISQKCGHRNDQVTDSQLTIIGGTEARRNEFPWQISLQIDDAKVHWFHTCGGSILNERWIVTAAHCITKDKDYFRVVAGAQYKMRKESTTQMAEIDRIIVHPQFKRKTLQSDIALIKLKTKLHLDPKSVYPICLPESNEENAFNGQVCVASGWGKTKNGKSPTSEVLRKVDLPIVEPTICKQQYSHIWNVRIDREKVCAGYLNKGGKSICEGDSGGPLACLKNDVYKLVGLSSFEVKCGTSGIPSGFTRLSAFREWIDGHISG